MTLVFGCDYRVVMQWFQPLVFEFETRGPGAGASAFNPWLVAFRL
jgi:hypothetical protein